MWPSTIFDLMTSPTTVYAYLSKFGYIFSLFSGAATYVFTGGEVDDYFGEEVRQGSFKDAKKWQRDLIKGAALIGIPVSNLYENLTTAGLKAKMKFYHGLSPNVFFDSNYFTHDKKKKKSKSKKKANDPWGGSSSNNGSTTAW